MSTALSLLKISINFPSFLENFHFPFPLALSLSLFFLSQVVFENMCEYNKRWYPCFPSNIDLLDVIRNKEAVKWKFFFREFPVYLLSHFI